MTTETKAIAIIDAPELAQLEGSNECTITKVKISEEDFLDACRRGYLKILFNEGGYACGDSFFYRESEGNYFRLDFGY